MPVGRKEGKPLLRMLTGGPGGPRRCPADLADAPGRPLSAGIPGAAGAGAELPRFLLHPRSRRRGDAAAHPALRLRCAPSCSPISWSMPACAGPGGALRRRPWARCSSRCASGGYRPARRPRACAIAWRRSSRPCGGSRRPAAGDDADRLCRRALDRRQLHDRGRRRQRFRQCQALAYGEPELFAALIDLLVEAHRRLSRRPDRGRRRGAAALRQLGRRPAGARAAALVLEPDRRIVAALERRFIPRSR